jgi:hypothetical protein
MIPALLLIACLLCLLACLAVLAIVVKCYTEILKDRKFDVREERTGRQVPGTPASGRASEAAAERARAEWGPPPTPIRGGGDPGAGP